MTKRILFLLAVILIGNMTAVNAKINYVPLYIVDTQPDVKVVKRTPTAPLFITQDDHKLILPDIDDPHSSATMKCASVSIAAIISDTLRWNSKQSKTRQTFQTRQRFGKTSPSLEAIHHSRLYWMISWDCMW